MPDLCPKGADLGVKTSAPFCKLALPLYQRLLTEQGENQSTLPVGVASVLVEIQTVPVAVETIKRIQKVHRSLYGANFTLWAYLKRYNVCLETDADSWLGSLNFGGNYCFGRWMAWTWDKGKEGTQNSPPSYWEPSDCNCQLQIGTYQEHCQELNNKGICHLPLWDWTPCCYGCGPSTTPEGVQGGVRHSVLQGIWWDRSLDVFRNRFYDFNPCISSYLKWKWKWKWIHSVVSDSLRPRRL